MAYVIAEMSLAEIQYLRAKGFELEAAPLELVPRLEDDTTADFEERVSTTLMTWVDCDAKDLLAPRPRRGQYDVLLQQILLALRESEGVDIGVKLLVDIEKAMFDRVDRVDVRYDGASGTRRTPCDETQDVFIRFTAEDLRDYSVHMHITSQGRDYWLRSVDAWAKAIDAAVTLMNMESK